MAALAVPAAAADLGGKKMAVKAPPAAAPATPVFDIAFGTAFTTDYILRGISQTNRKPAVQGYFEGRFNINDMIQLYAGVWGSNLADYIANAEFDISGGARFTYGNFGLDVGFVYYEYPDAVPITAIVPPGGWGYASFGEFYAKPSYKFNDWLTVGGSVIGGDNFNNTGLTAIYYTGNMTITLPQFLPAGFGAGISAEIGRQTFEGAVGIPDYTQWNAGVFFTYKAATLDLRYYDTDQNTAFCLSPTGSVMCDATFVATLKFDTTLAALK